MSNAMVLDKKNEPLLSSYHNEGKTLSPDASQNPKLSCGKYHFSP